MLIGSIFGSVAGWWTSYSTKISGQGGIEEENDSYVAVDPDRLYFGDQPPQREFQWALPLTNTTADTIDIVGFEQSCHCSSVIPENVSIPSGETRNIAVTLDLSPQDDKDLVASIREFAVTITPVFEDGRFSHEGWQLRGRISNPFRVEPAYLDYGESLVWGTHFPHREVTISCAEALRELRVDCHPPTAEVEVNMVNRKGHIFDVKVLIDQSLEIGDHEFELRLEGIREDGSKCAPGAVKAFARVVPDIEVFPPVVHFGTLSAGDVRTSEVTVRSRTGRTFGITRIEAKDDFVEASLDELSNGLDDSKHFELSCRANNVGLQIAKVYVHAESELTEQGLRVPLTVCYMGTEPVVPPPLRE